MQSSGPFSYFPTDFASSDLSINNNGGDMKSHMDVPPGKRFKIPFGCSSPSPTRLSSLPSRAKLEFFLFSR
jgi:hypothetical protein